MDTLVQFFEARNMIYVVIEDIAINSAFSYDGGDGAEQVFSFTTLVLEDAAGDQCVRFMIAPFIEQPLEGYPNSLHLTTSQINFEMQLLKFAFDSEGTLALIFDIPAHLLDDEQFDYILSVLGGYASHYLPELSALVGTEIK